MSNLRRRPWNKTRRARPEVRDSSFHNAISRSCNGVELIARGKRFLQPEPLHHRRLQQRSRRVGVVLQQLRRMRRHSQIEAPVEGRGSASQERSISGTASSGIPISSTAGCRSRAAPLCASSLRAHCSRPEEIDFLRGELVERRFIPIRLRSAVFQVRPAASTRFCQSARGGAAIRRIVTLPRPHRRPRRGPWLRIRRAPLRRSCKTSSDRTRPLRHFETYPTYES